MYRNIAQLLESAATESKSLAQIILESEAQLTDSSFPKIYMQMRTNWDVMQKSAVKALHTAQDMTPPLIAGQAQKQEAYSAQDTLCGTPFNHMMAMAFSSSEVNAAMGRICAAPTAGACGILPAVVRTVADKHGSNEAQILDALLVASGFGAIITANATISGAEGGCQAECGAAAAIAAAAAVTLCDGTPDMCANAVAIALINCMGLICDPVAGLVQLPCSFRNASQSANALASADMALAGQVSVIPPDEVIDAMYRVGKSLPSSMRETAEGGIAATQTGKQIAKEL
ncbi:MAG: L-serine ammonia-lyase, iron-sulfur-dependent, subunit alpha [Ruthenibacterium sp.]